ncbi:hypothetical protein AB7813_05605 [Tardiphaga sp. 20_F10_N6_6]|uniref:hypothetical protein n=1 Tax=Tardiphaga sp. 20_F10_N6_6 TaxID=3240788 RepID=UPI003F89EC27
MDEFVQLLNTNGYDLKSLGDTDKAKKDAYPPEDVQYDGIHRLTHAAAERLSPSRCTRPFTASWKPEDHAALGPPSKLVKSLNIMTEKKTIHAVRKPNTEANE